MSQQQITILGQSIRQQTSQGHHPQQKKAYNPILPNPRSSNSANYIPTKVYQSSSNIRQQPNNNAINTSQLSHTSRQSNVLNAQQLAAYQKLSQLTQRLKNVHHFYKLRIQQQRRKNSQRNEVFMSIVQQLQRNHNQKITIIKRNIQLASQDSLHTSCVDDRVSQIKISIDQLLKQSASYKSLNEQLQKQITCNEQSIQQKQKLLSKTIKQQKQYRDQLEEFMKMNVKQSKKQRQMLQMIDNVIDVRGLR